MIAGQVFDAQLVGLAGRVERIADQHEPARARRAAAGRRHRRRPSSTSARPSTDRPSPPARRAGETPSSSSRTAAISTGGRSGALRPGLRYGKSARTHGCGATARSIATSDGCVAVGAGARVEQHASSCGSCPTGSGGPSLRSRIALLAFVWSPPWSGWTARIRGAVAASSPRASSALVVPTGKPSTSSAHAVGSASADSVVRLGAGEVGDQRRPDRAPPPRRLVQHRRDDVPARLFEPLDGVHRTEHLGEIAAGGCRGRSWIVVVLADQAVPAVRRARDGRPGTGGAGAVARPGHRARSGRSAGARRDAARRRRRGCDRRRRRRAAARRSRAPGRPGGRGGRATRAGSARPAACARPRARRATCGRSTDAGHT